MGPSIGIDGECSLGTTNISRDTGFNGAVDWHRRRAHRTCGDAACSSRTLQWGRRLASTESASLSSQSRIPLCCFNGAVDWHRRRVEDHPIDRGPARQLQWGRRLASTERSVVSLASPPTPMLQWGRRLASTESGRRGLSLFPWAKLQWGRRLASTESANTRPVLPLLFLSFNGAVDWHRRRGEAPQRG